MKTNQTARFIDAQQEAYHPVSSNQDIVRKLSNLFLFIYLGFTAQVLKVYRTPSPTAC